MESAQTRADNPRYRDHARATRTTHLSQNKPQKRRVASDKTTLISRGNPGARALGVIAVPVKLRELYKKKKRNRNVM